MSKKMLAALEDEEKDLLLREKIRIESVVREHEELHPPYTEDCPICLESIPICSTKAMWQCFECGNGLNVNVKSVGVARIVCLLVLCAGHHFVHRKMITRL